MAQITSTDIANAIAFAKSDPEVSNLLQKRDADDALVCMFIKCTLLNRIEEPVKVYEVAFDYSLTWEDPLQGQDVVVTVEVTNGRAVVVDIKTP